MPYKFSPPPPTGNMEMDRWTQRIYERVNQLQNIYAGSGAPDASLGAAGDYYFRTDGTGTNHVYFNALGTWGGLV